MDTTSEGRLLWEPSYDVLRDANITDYMCWLHENRNLKFPDYDALWRWSVEDIDGFWSSVWDYFEIKCHRQYKRVLNERTIQGAKWFEGARLNYAEQALDRRDHHPALIAHSETRQPSTMSYSELADAVTRAATGFRKLGVRKGDRVAALMPNIPEAVIGFLASATIGAVWSSCAPEFGVRSVIDRFQQIKPKILLTVDGYMYGGRQFDLTDTSAKLRRHIPDLEATVLIPCLNDVMEVSDNVILWNDLLDGYDSQLHFASVDFNHPLWVLYSSGTTGLPKAIVQGHGGILIDHLKTASFHLDIGPNDRLFWYTSTGWMMWNFLMSGLLLGATIVLYDGDPARPDLSTLWQLADEVGITYFGTSAPFIHACMKAGLTPGRDLNLSAIRGLGSTGAPLSPEGFEWVYESVNPNLLLNSFSGGTDICTGIVGANPLLPVRAGEIPCRLLGAPVESFDEKGNSLVDKVGELVLTSPMPSMPLYLWNDHDGSRFRESYLTPYPNTWRHGDFVRITRRGSCVIYGRSDSTLNRGGVRTGTSDFYRVVDEMKEVAESLVIDTGNLNKEGQLVLMVVLHDESPLNKDLIERIKQNIRRELSPRHMPDEIHVIDEVPKTLNGKKMEVPIKKLFLGASVEDVVSRDSMANPEALTGILELLQR